MTRSWHWESEDWYHEEFMSALGGVHGALGRFSLLLVVDSMLCHSEQLIDLSIEKDDTRSSGYRNEEQQSSRCV
jgi:hypothetical protein